MHPTLAVSIGDPFGIGPEVVVKALDRTAASRGFVPLLVGDLRVVTAAADACGVTSRFEAVEAQDAAAAAADGSIPVLDVGAVDGPVTFGENGARGGAAAYRYLERAVEVITAGHADSLVTAPLSKYALEQAGLGHEGHTEILQSMTGSDWSLTMFVLDRLRTVFLSRHVSLSRAIELVTAERVITCVERFASVAGSLGITAPRIAVAALNPHAGEAGLFGREEIDELEPAVAELARRGHDIVGPIPADSLFHLAKDGRYDMLLSLYHDQAAGTLKSIDFHRTVSVTLGLPFLRFSVDHGTAFDIAGTGKADAANMANTFELAAEYTGARLAAR
jgi:4-hydroxythreonine-4-phosphate dehydrogenase